MKEHPCPTFTKSSGNFTCELQQIKLHLFTWHWS
jgi:hypothetical protein